MGRSCVVGSWAVLVVSVCSCGSSGGAGTEAPPDGGNDVQVAAPEASTSDALIGDASSDVSLDAPPEVASDAPADAQPSVCDNAGLLAGCVVGACTVSATGKPLPDGVSLTVTQKPVPADLGGDALGPVLCSIGFSADAGVQAVSALSLSIAMSATPDPSAILFQYVSSALSRAVPTSQPSATGVIGLVTAPGDFGATKRPGPWTLQGDLGIDSSSSSDQAALLRNLSSQPMYGSFYDGAHLYVCNGSRLLIYNGIPSSVGTPPNVVLGQPDLNANSEQITSSLFGNSFGCSSIWSDGKRLVVAQGNRILIWNSIPSQNAAPADLVLGQPDFSSNQANNGGLGAATLSSVESIDSDGTTLAAAEVSNNRVLVWSKFPTAVDQPADFVVGQPDFTSSAASHGAIPFNYAWGVAFTTSGLFVSGLFDPGVDHVSQVTASNPAADFTALTTNSYTLQQPDVVVSAGKLAVTPAGGLAIADTSLRRIDLLKTVPTGPAHIAVVLGQPDVTHVVSNPISASFISQSTSVNLGSGQAFTVPGLRRLLVFDTSPGFNFEPASRVVGQAGFTSDSQADYRGVSASTLALPADVAVSGGVVAVADRSNNRVVIYKKSDISAGNPAASVVLGQPDSTSYVANSDQAAPSAARMSGPAGVALDGTHLIVSDTENHRVLIWNTVPSTTATPADLVLGQADFAGRRPNRGRGDANGDSYSDADADGFFYPVGVASDATHLFVADRLNNRVLVWNSFPTSNGQRADAVIGQANFTTPQANRGGGGFTCVPDGLNLPTGVTLVGTTLWVADTENNRVVRWDNVTTTPAPGAFVGQASGSSVANPNYGQPADVSVGFAKTAPTTTTSVIRPRGVALAGTQLFVSESDSNRVHMFNAATLAPDGELGQTTDTTSTANAGGLIAASLQTPLGVASDGSTVWVADSANHRVLGFDASTAPATGAAATTVLGQASFFTGGFNQASTAASGVTSQPTGVALANGALYVADTANSRVLVFKTPVSGSQTPTRVIGQPDSSQARPNSGGPPSARTLNVPEGVFADAKHIVIADTGNNRVLVYDAMSSAPDAILVLGQSTFTVVAPSSAGPTATSMHGPTGVYTDGTSLWVADTGNHRVLAWSAFPTSNGQAADLVIGQTNFSGGLSNQGGSAATAATLSFPSAIDRVGGVLYVADAGNNRVVSFSTPPSASGASADGVLGQADLVSRSAALNANDFSHLAGPVGIADDGENLYVTDRDLGRVLVYTIGNLAAGTPPSFAIGASGGLALSRPSAVAVERTPFFTSRLYVADTGNDQVAIVQSVPRLLTR